MESAVRAWLFTLAGATEVRSRPGAPALSHACLARVKGKRARLRERGSLSLSAKEIAPPPLSKLRCTRNHRRATATTAAPKGPAQAASNNIDMLRNSAVPSRPSPGAAPGAASPESAHRGRNDMRSKTRWQGRRARRHHCTGFT